MVLAPRSLAADVGESQTNSHVIPSKAGIQIRGTAVGATFAVGLGFASLAPMIIGWIATVHSIAAGLPLLALSFYLLGPLFFWFAPDVTRRDLVDFVGQKVG